jgi:plastocyanin
MQKAAVALILILAALGLAACGGGDSSTSVTIEESTGAEAAGGGEGGSEAEGGTAGTAAAIAIEADPGGNLAFKEKEVTAKPGEDAIDFTNQSSTPHNVAIEDSSGKQLAETETLTEGNAATTVELEPGTYTFYCSVPDHREAGMEGTLTVK